MKKLFAVLSVFAVLVACYETDSDFSLQNYFSGVYYCYTENEPNCSNTDLGFCYMSELPSKNCVGESMTIENFEPVSALSTLNAQIVKTECLENGAIVIYAYSELVPNSVKVENNLVNIQIACYDDHCVIGWPLIYGSF